MKAAAVIVAGLLTLCAQRASAQTDFSGTWTLDREISADPSKATFEPPKNAPRRNAGGFSGGFGGRGFGGRNGSSARQPSGDNQNRGAAALTVDEQTKLRELAAYLKGFTSLVIVHSDHSTLAITDAQGSSRLFPTDGSKSQYALATTTVDSTTSWDGPHLVTIYTIGPTHELLFTYAVLPATKQMVLRVRLEESGHPRQDVPELRLVYRLKTATTSSGASAGDPRLLGSH